MQKPNNIKAGDQFRVIEGDNNFHTGEIITLKDDVGGYCPYFWNADKSDYWSIYFSNLEPYPKTIRDAQVGDVVVGKNTGFEHMVLERGQRTVLLSYENNFKKSDDNYHFDELEAQFTLKTEPEPVDISIIITMDQIAEKFGVEVSKLKIAKD